MPRSASEIEQALGALPPPKGGGRLAPRHLAVKATRDALLLEAEERRQLDALAAQRSPLEELLRLLQRSQSEALALQRSAFAELQAARAQVETDKKAAETERKGLEQKAKDKVLKRLRRNLALVETGPQGVLETASVGRTKILGN